MKNSKGITGKFGEEKAKELYISKGYEIIAENFRFERAETDLIVKNEQKKVLVFAEVKTRTNKKFGEPEESISERKQEQLIKSAEGYIINNPGFEEYDKRFDVIAIYVEGNNTTINHIENAF